MSKKFTKVQIEELLKNKNVVRCKKTIVYNKDFKIKAVKLYKQGLSPQEIFQQAGFDLLAIGRKKPGNLIRDWSIICRKKGTQGLRIETRGKGKGGGRHKTKFQTSREKIVYLENQVAYLKAENDFLAKLRAKRAE
jgi:transposase-like protein